MIPRWWPAFLAPALVALGLLVLHQVWFVFLAYHVALCLGLPLLAARREGLDARALARRLGLVREGLGTGLGLGALALAVPPLALLALPAAFPAAGPIRAVLADWGATGSEVPWVLLFLAAVNGPAEELFWRGYLQDRLLRGLPSAALLVLLFSSYHTVTVGALAPGPAGLALMLGGVVGAAAFWTWSRRRWDSLWPALLSHLGATVGYVAVSWRILHP